MKNNPLCIDGRDLKRLKEAHRERVRLLLDDDMDPNVGAEKIRRVNMKIANIVGPYLDDLDGRGEQ